MASQEDCRLILAAARVLFVNGQSTSQTVAAAEQLAQKLGLSAQVLPRWGQMQVTLRDQAGQLHAEPADPTGVHMLRVASATSTITSVAEGRLAPQSALPVMEGIAAAPPSPTWLFALAAAAGAVALAVIFGVARIEAAALIFLSAAAGALLRRALARRTANLLLQPFLAALVAGIVGGVAVRCDLSSSLRLVAVCPCMVLVPGPHFLNGALDLVDGRIHVGAARLLYALLVVTAIAAGLLLGLTVLGVSLPVDPAGRLVPLWQDVIAAGVAVFAYSVFFSMPLNMMPWPVAIGILAHALRWVAITVLGMGAATGALVACAVAGVALTPVSHHRHMPFAAIGFAAVVSLVPGVNLFRTASGLVLLAAGPPAQGDLLGETAAAAVGALIILLAMSLGLIVPKMLIDAVYAQRQLARSAGKNERGDSR